MKQHLVFSGIILAWLIGCTAGSATTGAPTATPSPTAAATVTATPEVTRPAPVKHNADWTPVIQEFAGVEMVLVPPGCFKMGSLSGQAHEAPINPQCLDSPFWLDRTEVTNAQFGASGTWTGDLLPRETLTWQAARAHCESRGARLPTEIEWEYAARGPDSRVYPWGNQFDGTRANFCDARCSYSWKDWTFYDGYRNTAPVGSFPAGASWVGAQDMAGNVWEWTSTMFRSYPYDPADGREGQINPDRDYVLRGGSYFNYAYALRSSYRFKDPPRIVYDIFGFRCAREF
jgi:serine/threonine-protein kinase